MKKFLFYTLLILVITGAGLFGYAKFKPVPAMPSTAQSITSEQASTCSEDELSSMDVLRSTDHGATWTSLGKTCIKI